MSIAFALTTDEVVEREKQISQLFSALSLEEIERRRAALVLVKKRFSCSMSMGAYQYVTMAIQHLEETIIESAAQHGDALSEATVRRIEDQAMSDRDFEAKLSNEILQAESQEFQDNMAKAYGFETASRPNAND